MKKERNRRPSRKSDAPTQATAVPALDSPIPAEGYRRDDHDLLRPKPAPLDTKLIRVVRRFAKADARTRRAIRQSIRSGKEYNSLYAFALRSTVFALRRRNLQRVADGLAAVAMIEYDRFDYRDVHWALDLLVYAARRIGADVPRLLRESARLADPKIAEIMTLPWRFKKTKVIERPFGYGEVVADGVLGLAARDSGSFEPTCDLLWASLKLARLFEKGGYRDCRPELGGTLPEAWIESDDQVSLKRILDNLRACATIKGALRLPAAPQERTQELLTFLVEAKEDSVAARLSALAQQGEPTGFASLGVANRNLFCLVIAGSWWHDVSPIETRQSLRRFEAGILRILKNCPPVARDRLGRLRTTTK